MNLKIRNLERIGWREWVYFPDIKNISIKAKIDTGARTSALHAENIKIRKIKGVDWASFDVHPLQRSALKKTRFKLRVTDWRNIKSSNGASELRPVVVANIRILDKVFEIELTLTNRDNMGFRLLIGRRALRKHYLVDSGRSYLGRKKSKL